VLPIRIVNVIVACAAPLFVVGKLNFSIFEIFARMKTF